MGDRVTPEFRDGERVAAPELLTCCECGQSVSELDADLVMFEDGPPEPICPSCAAGNVDPEPEAPELLIYWATKSADDPEDDSLVIYDDWERFKGEHPHTAECLPREHGASLEIRGELFVHRFDIVELEARS
jgi:hypothetical protein